MNNLFKLVESTERLLAESESNFRKIQGERVPAQGSFLFHVLCFKFHEAMRLYRASARLREIQALRRRP